MTKQEKMIYIAKQIHKAIQLTLQNQAFDDEYAVEVAEVYPEWEVGKLYTPDTILRYGVNKDDEAQLYRVLQEHTSQADWTPDTAVSLYKAIGIGGDGIPVWTQPYGASDAYQTGDRVHFPTAEDPIYESVIDNNTWSPEAYPQGWKQI